MKNKTFKSLLCLTLAFLFVFSAASGIFSVDSVVKAADVFCNVKFSKPAICCDAGDKIDLTKCGVQFTAETGMVTSGITWTVNGSKVTSYTPSSAGTYTLVAKSGSLTKTIYVVAKNPSDSEYVLYTTDFQTTAGFREVEKTGGAYWGISGGVCYMDASQSSSSSLRILLPEMLDDFGDMKIYSSVRLTSVNNGDSRWGSIMYRVQDSKEEYMQACMRANIAGESGLEIAQRINSGWNVVSRGPVDNVNTYYYYDVSIDVKGTQSVVAINGTDMITYTNTPYTAGGIGFGVSGLRYTVDYLTVVLEGNDEPTTYSKASYAKPALRADMGDVIDLTKCDVQLTADALYTKGSNITWKHNGKTITQFIPSTAGVTALTATANGITKNVYVVTRRAGEGEYILYYNDFSSAPTDFRVLEETGSASVYHDAAAGTYVLNASGSENNYARVLLPSFLDEFGNFKIETSVKESSPVSERNWFGTMYRVQNGNFPYMQMCVRYNAALADGTDISQKLDTGDWYWYLQTSGASKVTGAYNVYAVSAQNNVSTTYINGTQVASIKNSAFVNGALGFQVRGLSASIDYVKITLGDVSPEEDTTVKCGVAASLPAIGCNAGQTVLLEECDVQMVYGAPTVKGSEITWTHNGKVIKEFEAPVGISVLKANYNGREKEIWVIGKRSTESEYIFYYNDFNDPSYANDIRVIETSNGGKAYWDNGQYVLNGSASADTYVRVLLPEWLSIFGDGEYLAVLKLTNPVDSTKWASMMYRVQNGDFPYAQGCLRYDATAANGLELATKTESGAWNVTQKGNYTGMVKDGYNWWSVNPSAKYTYYNINGYHALHEYSTPYSNGDWGFQVRGLTLTIDAVKLSFQANHTKADIYTLPGHYADVRDPETGIRIAPSIVSEVKTLKEFNEISKTSPAVAIVTYKYENGTGKIVFSDGTVTLERALDAFAGTIIPAFRVNDNASVDALVSYLKENEYKDTYVVSDNPSYIKRATDAWKYIKGVQDFTNVSLSAKAEDIRTEAVANGSRVMMLPNNYCTKENVTYLHDMFSCVWIIAGEGKTATVEAVNKGPYGIVTPNREVTDACYREFYAESTMIRRPNVIGHRGVPTMAPENSLSGLQTALSNGSTAVETDIYITTDGVLMNMHDDAIDRTTTGSGYIEEMSSTQLKQYLIDHKADLYGTEPIPSLEDFFIYCKADKSRRLVIEIKTGKQACAPALKALIDKYDLREQIVIISFGSAPLAYIRELMPGIPVSNLASVIAFDENDPITSASNVIARIQDFDSVYSPGYAGLGYNVIRECIYRGVSLWPWTVDDKSTFDNLWFNCAGGITTNFCQWANNYIADLYINANGRVIAKTYKGNETDVTNLCEMVVVEDTLGISFSNGVVNVPQKVTGGKASYFFRYKSKTASGHEYYAVTGVKTVEVQGTVKETLTLKNGSSLKIENSILTGLTNKTTVKDVKAQFEYSVVIKKADGSALSDNAVVPTGAVISLASDSSKKATAVLKGDVNGDGAIDTTDYLQIKSYFLNIITLDGIYFTAADVDVNNKIDTTDYLKLKSHFLGMLDIYK